MGPSTEYVIEVRNLVKDYVKHRRPPVRAVDGITFSVRRGEILGLLGPNGAGKSTTIKVLTTLLKPTSGSAMVFGHDVLHEPLLVRRHIVAVLQEHAVELYLSLRDNLRTFGRFHGLPTREIERQADRILDIFGLAEYGRQKPIDLSGGLKRRLQVGKVFMVDKPVIFLDEATTGMDTMNKRIVLGAFREETRRGRTIVLTTHIMDEAEALCDSAVIINHGKIVAAGSIAEVKALSLHLFTITLTFDPLTDEIVEHLRSFPTHSFSLKNNTVELAVRDQASTLEILTATSARYPIGHFEVSGTSLEDAFVRLLDATGGRQ